MDSQEPRPFDQLIFLIRGHKVMLSTDLARLYEVPTKALIQAVKRNGERFPPDFMFQLEPEELLNLRSQIVTSSWGGHRYPPFAFTEQGVAMLSSVLKSSRAIRINIAIMRAFVKIRETLSLHKELAIKLETLERRIAGHDADIQTVFDAIGELTRPDDEPTKRIGFRPQSRR